MKEMFAIAGIGLAVILVCVSAALVGMHFSNEAACGQKVEGNFEFIDGDYRFLSDTCYVTLTDGRTISYDRYRFED